MLTDNIRALRQQLTMVFAASLNEAIPQEVAVGVLVTAANSRSYSKYCRVTHFIFLETRWDVYYFYTHFRNEETEHRSQLPRLCKY